MPITAPPSSAPPPQTISTRLISVAPPPKCRSVMSGKSTPTGMMKNQTAMTSVKSQPMPGVACMAANPSRNSRHRFGRRSLRAGLGMWMKSSVVQAATAPATSSSRMLPIEEMLSSRAPRAGPAMSENETIIWLTPAMRVSSCSGASSGTEACMAGRWKAEPAERQASSR